MERYSNFGGDSSVAGYEIGWDSIAVLFRDGLCYLYTYQSAGSANVERMIALAVSGSGLNSFIMRNMRKRYAARIR